MASIRKQDSELQKSLEQLLSSGADDASLFADCSKLAQHEHFPSFTWLWGPRLATRDRLLFGPLILQSFSEWTKDGKRWSWIPWSDHSDQLEGWLAHSRSFRDTVVVRKLLRWKYNSGLDVNHERWNAELLKEFSQAGTIQDQLLVLHYYDEAFVLQEATAVALYQTLPSAREYILKKLAVTQKYSKRQLWRKLVSVADTAGDASFCQAVTRKTIAAEEWLAMAIELAEKTQDSESLLRELTERIPEGHIFIPEDSIAQLLELRGTELLPLANRALPRLAMNWQKSNPSSLQEIAARKEWWDLWIAIALLPGQTKYYREAVEFVLDDLRIDEISRLQRLQRLSSAHADRDSIAADSSRFPLNDAVATKLYRSYPWLLQTAFRHSLTFDSQQTFPKLLELALASNDRVIVDALATNYVTQIVYEKATSVQVQHFEELGKAIEALANYYEQVHRLEPLDFTARAAWILSQVRANAIRHFQELLRTNCLARLLFVRSFDVYLSLPNAVADLLSASNERVLELGFQLLSQRTPAAIGLAAEHWQTLMESLSRKARCRTQLAAMGALFNAAQTDRPYAEQIAKRTRELLNDANCTCPREKLLELLAKLIDTYPDLALPAEARRVYRKAELSA